MCSGFENHDHVYKRTFPIKHDQVSESFGTVFLGDGSWSVEPRISHSTDNWYLAELISGVNYYLYVSVSPLWVQVNAYDANNDSIDETLVFPQ